MKKKVFKKLKDTTGASLILVMVLFLMCVMVSSVIVATASAGASRNAKRKHQQQQYLSIMSAARLMAEEMKPENSGTFVGTATLWDFGCNKEGDRQHRREDEHFLEGEVICSDITESSGDNVWEVDAETSLDGVLEEILLEACTKIYVEKEPYYETEFWIEPDDERLMEVHCKFSMDFNYDVAISFSTDGTSYAMTLQCGGYSNTSTDSDDDIIHDKHVMEYKETNEENGSIETKQGNHDVGATLIIKTTRVDWPAERQELRKGGE